jgi:hypothetical protein
MNPNSGQVAVLYALLRSVLYVALCARRSSVGEEIIYCISVVCNFWLSLPVLFSADSLSTTFSLGLLV